MPLWTIILHLHKINMDNNDKSQKTPLNKQLVALTDITKSCLNEYLSLSRRLCQINCRHDADLPAECKHRHRELLLLPSTLFQFLRYICIYTNINGGNIYVTKVVIYLHVHLGKVCLQFFK